MATEHGQQPASSQVPPRITPASEVPRPTAPRESEPVQPRFVSVRALQASATQVIQELSEANESAVIVRHGKLLAVISPISGDDVLHEAFGRLAQQLPDAAEIASEVHAGELYRHFKGGMYRIVRKQARSSESDETFVVYEDCASDEVWVRPSTMFAELVEVDGAMVPRFERISDQSVDVAELRERQLKAIDTISKLDLIPDGYCTCDGPTRSGRMRDCGIAAHRAEAERERHAFTDQDVEQWAAEAESERGYTGGHLGPSATGRPVSGQAET